MANYKAALQTLGMVGVVPKIILYLGLIMPKSEC
jgi:hypothetical protein